MELKTYDTVLTELCDNFDTLISPLTITRANTNIIYLMLKAVAKGMEVINNVCVTVSNKFDPLNCSDEDLESVATLVGTKRKAGSGSGLRITVTNPTDISLVLLKGTYQYAQTDDIIFEFEVLSNTTIASGSAVSYIAMTTTIGEYAVTRQDSITVTSETPVDENFKFSCGDNTALLGVAEESLLDFRNRLATTTDRQNSMEELELTLQNLPYLFDAKVTFNNSTLTGTYDGYTLPPYTCLICYSGEAKNEIAEKVANYILCPTVKGSDAVEVRYESNTFINGYQSVYINPFKKANFSVKVIYTVNTLYNTKDTVESAMTVALNNSFVAEVHRDYVKEEDIYSVLKALTLKGADILGVNILDENGDEIDYLAVPATRIPNLVKVEFEGSEV